ncbi:MAG: SAM-dependent methyltransferase [Bifidobacterium crudilactis]|nr:SAM-dependent methyltransferase [Bifidobacterium crudilactis]
MMHDHDHTDTHAQLVMELKDARTEEQVKKLFSVPVLVKTLVGQKGDRYTFARYVRYLTHESPSVQAAGKYHYPDNAMFASDGYDWRADVDALTRREGYKAPLLDEIRRKLVEAGFVDCIVAMPSNLFFNTTIPVSLWFVSKDRAGNGHRERHDEVLFIDARKFGRMESRKLRVLDDDDIKTIADTYHAWRNYDGGYEDLPGIAKAAKIAEIEKYDYVLTPSRYVGSEEAEVDDEPIAEKIARLTNELFAEFEHGRELEQEIRVQLRALGAK